MRNFKIISLLLLVMPVVGNAYGAYYHPYGKYESSYNTQQYQKNNKSDLNIRFFVGLNTALVSYDKTEIKYKTAGVSEEQTTTKINYDIFDKAGFVFGIDSDYGFRLSLGAQHYNADTKFVDGSNSDASVLALGAMLDIPFVKKEITSPFLRLGANYISVDQNDVKIHFPAYYVGLGVTHNFTKNIFGTLVATYAFMAKTDVAKVDATYQENALTVSMGLGYRF